jgi:hypothetical protein
MPWVGIMKTYKITLKLVRSFGLGVTVMAPSLNGLCVEVQLACVCLTVWSRGRGWLGFKNYWDG